MAKRTAPKRGKKGPPPEDPQDTKNARITVFKANEQTAMEPAPEPAENPVVLPTPEDAVRVLKELADLNDLAGKARERYEDLKARTKTAKEKYDDLAAQVLTRLHVCTHKSDLPLFSEEREADQARMENAGQDAPDATENDDPVSGEVEVSPAALDAPLEAPAAEDTVPF